MSTNLHTDFGGMLRILQAQGSHYLTSQELDAYLRRHIDGYYRFLGKSLLRGRDRAFWDYHRKQLEDAGLGFSRVRVLSGMLATVLGVALPWRDPMARFTKTKTRSTSPLDRVPDDSEPVAVQSSKRAG
jgi:hypothetical protein